MPSAKPAAVGGFVLGALIIAVVAILFFGGWLSPFPATWTWTFYLPALILLPTGLWVIWDGIRYETIFGKIILPGIGAAMCVMAVSGPT